MLDDLKNPTDAQLVWGEAAAGLVRFAWQLPVAEANGSWPSSFEDSLVLTNMPWFKALMEGKADDDGVEIEPPTGALGSVARAAAEAGSVAEMVKALHTVMHGSLRKGEFAASIFERLSSDEPVVCPKYIADALAWLQAQLEPSKEPMT